MRIADVSARPLYLRFREPYHWAGRVDGGAAVLLISVVSDTGMVGWGESTAPLPADGALCLVRALADRLRGGSVFDTDRIVRRERFLGGFNDLTRFANLTLAGLEMALWDLMGRAAGWPVHRFWGGLSRTAVDYFGFVQGDTAEQLARSAGDLAAAGHGVMYLKVGRGEAADLDNTAAVREAIGNRRLRLDANEAWDPATAVRMIRLLEPFAPEFIEQPTPARNIAALRQVRESVGVPIAADQSVFTIEDVYEICRQRAADLIVLSPHETGGLSAFRKAAAVAEAAGLAICLHGQSVSGISDCAQHMVGLTLPNLTEGNQIMHQLLDEDLILTPCLTPRQGRIGVIDEPGLGFTLNADAVERAAEAYCAWTSENRSGAAFRP